jgi:exopolysaccharide biosynthesis WecB/TagA/CpsF family protein
MLVRNPEFGVPDAADTARIGPLNILRLNTGGALKLLRFAVQSGQPLDIAICNAHTVMTAVDDPASAETLQSMSLLNDGVGINIASMVLRGEPFPENLNGTDLVPAILDKINIPLRVYLLGAREQQVQAAKAHIEATYPVHEVVGVRNGYFDASDVAGICEAVTAAKPDLLLVAMGNPRQERFIIENRHRLGATITIGVGALFDFMSGTVRRAPMPVQAIGLEWLFRLLQEPRRLSKRYMIGIPRFFYQVLRWKLFGTRPAVSRVPESKI